MTSTERPGRGRSSKPNTRLSSPRPRLTARPKGANVNAYWGSCTCNFWNRAVIRLPGPDRGSGGEKYELHDNPAARGGPDPLVEAREVRRRWLYRSRVRVCVVRPADWGA